MSEALRGTQRHSEALTEALTEALRGTQRHSEALRGTQRHSRANSAIHSAHLFTKSAVNLNL